MITIVDHDQDLSNRQSLQELSKGRKYLVSVKHLDGSWSQVAINYGFDQGMRVLVQKWEKNPCGV